MGKFEREESWVQYVPDVSTESGMTNNKKPMKLPWQIGVLNEWNIVGMNHYHINGKKHLFVAMTKDGRCIQEEGPDAKTLWLNLWVKASEGNDKPAMVRYWE